MLNIGGFTPFTTIDYPDHMSAVVFLQGCPWRCGYCHNRELLDAGAPGTYTWKDIAAFLHGRRGLLDAVVFSGGEPTMQPGLLRAAKDVKNMGFLVGLHTGGAFPDALPPLFPHLDWIGMDIKAHFSGYQRITGVAGSGEAAEQSAALVRASGVRRRFRTTVDPGLLSPAQVSGLRRMVEDEWGSEYDVQEVVLSSFSGRR